MRVDVNALAKRFTPRPRAVPTIETLPKLDQLPEQTAPVASPTEGADEVNVRLSGREPWNGRLAAKLMCDADALCELLGVDGRQAEVQDAAAMVVSANSTHDMETVRFAVANFTDVLKVAAKSRRGVTT